MNAALWGAVTAAGWGTGDFVARYTSRALGTPVALAGMLLVSALGLTPLVWSDLGTLAWHPLAGPLAIAAGIGITFATLLLYRGLARGPVTVVAPISSCYPAFAMLIAVARGARPGPLEWLAIGIVLAGVVVVARFAAEDDGKYGYSHAQVRAAVLTGLSAAAAFAVAVLVAQEAAKYYGGLQSLWLARWIGLVCLLAVMAVRRRNTPVPVRWWPALGLQGLLDSGAYFALFAAANYSGAELAVVVSSGFSAVTVLLARFVLREAMTVPQWLGIATIVGGVAMLAWYS